MNLNGKIPHRYVTSALFHFSNYLKSVLDAASIGPNPAPGNSSAETVHTQKRRSVIPLKRSLLQSTAHDDNNNDEADQNTALREPPAKKLKSTMAMGSDSTHLERETEGTLALPVRFVFSGTLVQTNIADLSSTIQQLGGCVNYIRSAER